MPRHVDRPRMLVLADDPTATAIRGRLAGDGLAAVTHESATDAWQSRLDEDDLDCVAIAHDLPDATGPECLLQVRDGHPELPVVLFGQRVSEGRAGDGGQTGRVTAEEDASADLTEYVSGDGPMDLADGIETVVRAWIDAGRIPEPHAEREETTTGGDVDLFAESPDPIAAFEYEDGAPVIADVNAAFEEAFGCTAETVVGDTLDEVVLTVGHGGGHADLLDPTESVETELRCRTIEGVKVFLLRSVPAGDGTGYAVYTEISDYKSVEQRYSALVKSSSDVLMILDRDGTVTYVSPAIEEAFGHAPGQLHGQQVLDWIHPDDCDEVVERLFEDPMSWAGETRSVTYRFRNADGDWRVVESAAKSRLYDPAVEGIVINCRDVTEREQRKNELERYEAIAETVPVGVLVVDEDDEIEWINDRGADLLGVDREVVEGLSPTDLVEEGFVESSLIDTYTEAVPELLRSEEYTRRIPETPVYPADGDRRVVDLHLGVLSGADGEYHGTVSAFQDITERKEYERKLTALHEATRELMSATTAREVAEAGIEAARDVLGIRVGGVHFVDEDGQRLESVAATEEAHELFGEIPDLEAGDSIAWEVFESGESAVVDDVADREDAKNPETPIRSELIIPLGEHGILLAGSDREGEFDEADRSLAEVLAANMQRGLDRAEREQELKRQNERLDQFASFVSHDLRNPLNVANGFLEAAMETGDERHLEEIGRSLDRMEQLIEELLTLARQGDAIGDLEPVSLESVAHDAWSTVRTDEVDLTVEDSAILLADRTRLRQMFENLIRNVTEHAGQHPQVWVGTVDDGDEDEPSGVYFEDDGPGIPAEERDSIFEAGYTTHEEGTGFGLGIVEQVVDAHDWEIHVEDGREGGARFVVTGVEFD